MGVKSKLGHTTELLARVRAKWRAEGCCECGPVKEADISRIERALGLNLPRFVRSYFRELNGILGSAEGASDSDLVSFWPLERILTLTGALDPWGAAIEGSDDVIVLADVSFEAYFVCVSCVPGKAGRVFLAGRSTLDPVADTAEEFFENYATLGDRALFPGPTLLLGRPR